MERLTKRELDGGKAMPYDFLDCNCEEYCQLAKNCCDCTIQDCYNKLAKYEDLEEQGRLLELPFRMTQEVYTIFNHKVVKGEFAGVYFRGIDTWFAYDHVDYDVCYHGMIIHAEDLFETKEEAEAKLKKMEENDVD